MKHLFYLLVLATIMTACFIPAIGKESGSKCKRGVLTCPDDYVCAMVKNPNGDGKIPKCLRYAY
ncbi:hypothetical protein C0J52_28166 [Blattella germanica]|nr:hypothetical protein C0J52_28166 [Blattella germanica]